MSWGFIVGTILGIIIATIVFCCWLAYLIFRDWPRH